MIKAVFKNIQKWTVSIMFLETYWHLAQNWLLTWVQLKCKNYLMNRKSSENKEIFVKTFFCMFTSNKYENNFVKLITDTRYRKLANFIFVYHLISNFILSLYKYMPFNKKNHSLVLQNAELRCIARVIHM